MAHWNTNLPGNKRKAERKDDLDGFEKEILQPLEALLRRGCEKVFLTGNHDRSLEQDLIGTMPELDGMIDFKKYLPARRAGLQGSSHLAANIELAICSASMVRLLDRAEAT